MNNTPNFNKILEVDLTNCYGISRFQYTFNFSSNNNCYVLYAPNGTMKTSFAKTVLSYQKNEKDLDSIFNFPSSIHFRDEYGVEYPGENFIVIESFNNSFESKNINILLSNEQLKNEYHSITSNLIQIKDTLLNSIKNFAFSSKVSISEIENELLNTFQISSIFQGIENISTLLSQENSTLQIAFDKFKYSDYINSDVKKFIEDPKNSNFIQQYATTVQELIRQSDILNESFTYSNAINLISNMDSSGFFSANHSIILSSGKSVKNADDFRDLIDKEKEKLLLSPSFSNVISKLSSNSPITDSNTLNNALSIDISLDKNKTTRKLKEILNQYPLLLLQFESYNNLKLKVWITILSQFTSDLNYLHNEFTKCSDRMKEIAIIAQNELPKWSKILKIFKKRFHVPFNVEIVNQSSVILNNQPPTLKFIYENIENGIMEMSKEKLFDVLSTGEARALYLLNVIFELESLKEKNEEKFIIIDDIVDSFDYKNKHAIIQYLNDFSENPKFYFLIFSHNFDFFRTISSRNGINRNFMKIVSKHNNEITLNSGAYLQNAFKYFKTKCINDEKMLIASIPFFRNIVEYIHDSEHNDFIFFTNLLHFKKCSNPTLNTENIDTDLIISKINNYFNINFNINNNNALDIILRNADTLIAENDSFDIKLEHKAILSMAIRLQSEKQILTELGINNTEHIQSNQTFYLIREYTNYPNSSEIFKDILKRVNVLIPENIHLNSFMIEPLIDMSISHLLELYTDLKNYIQENTVIS